MPIHHRRRTPFVESLEGRQLFNAVLSFTLINSQTDQPIRTLNNGDTINLATLPAGKLNVRANTDNQNVKSVRFALDGNNNFNLEGTAPYALFGDTGSDYNDGTFSLGQHTLRATPFSGAGATGTAGTFKQITFNVINQAPTPTPTAPPPFYRFVLMNADTDTEIKTLTNGEVLNLANLPTRNINVLATFNTVGVPIKSVKFGLDANDNFNIEGTAPYALFGDTGSDLHAGTFSLGQHTLRAQAFSGINATGVAGALGVIQFTVIDPPT